MQFVISSAKCEQWSATTWLKQRYIIHSFMYETTYNMLSLIHVQSCSVVSTEDWNQRIKRNRRECLVLSKRTKVTIYTSVKSGRLRWLSWYTSIRELTTPSAPTINTFPSVSLYSLIGIGLELDQSQVACFHLIRVTH